MQDVTPDAHEWAAFVDDPAHLARHWPALHRGDALPWPDEAAVRQAWALYHAGRWQQAWLAARAAGRGGLAVACRVQALYATYLEPTEKRKLELLLEVARWCRARQAEDATDADAWYWQAYALGRYAQGVQVTTCVGQELALQIRSGLERALRLRPAHAEAHFALGAFQAEVVDRLGTFIAQSLGATAHGACAMFERGLALHPRSVYGRLEYAQGLLLLEGESAVERAEALYRDAAAVPALDAAERLGTEIARTALQE